MDTITNLHCHTEYSFLDGTIKLDDLCQKAHGLGMSAVAITDHGNICGLVPLYLKAKEYGLKTIPGCEFYTCGDHKDETQKKDRHHLILLAQNNTGYANLRKLSSISYDSRYFSSKPRIDHDLIKDYSEGLICLSACLSGEIPKAILKGDIDEARRLVRKFKFIFPNRFYLEVQRNKLADQERINAVLRELAESETVPLVATTDCHYLDKMNAGLHEIALCVDTHKTLSDPKRIKFGSTDFFFKSPEKMRRDFFDMPDAIESIQRIVESCNVGLSFDRHFFPAFPMQGLMKPKEKLEYLARIGLKNLGLERKFKYLKRLQFELETICGMGFASYFLMVHDFITYSRNQGIPVGPGRGSAASSLVAYALGITEIDPVRYNLLFERFLNPERVSLPDIDIDFCEKRRDEVIRYMQEKYGDDRVCRLPTFSTMKARGALRDVARAMDLPHKETDKLAKMIPDGMTLTEARNGIFKDVEEKFAKAVNMASEMEGMIRHSSVHASGIIVSDTPLSERIPTWTQKGIFLSQWDGGAAEKMGMLKFDFLGLSTLTIIHDTLKKISKNIDLSRLPLDDPETYDIFCRGETKGVFQVESPGMTNYMMELQPRKFEDLIAMLALYRPGPLENEMVNSFVKRRHGLEKIEYMHENLEPCLRETYGVIVYQEQVMEIARVIAGYTLGQADLLRRAMGKKKPEEMAKERKRFMEGATKNGIDQTLADRIFSQMETFAEYGFNKPHSAAYALLTYRTAWLKAHYPCEFMAALLTDAADDDDKKASYVAECKRMGIKILVPNINRSESGFIVEDGAIRWGLSGIKKVGQKAVQEILAKRGAGFESIDDFCARISKRSVTETVKKALKCAGAFDSFGPLPKNGSLKQEKEALGVYLSGHPLDGIDGKGCISLADCASLSGSKTADCVAMIVKVKKQTTKKGDPMAFLEISDQTGSADMVVWSDFLRDDFKANSIFRFTVKANKYKTGKADDKLRLECRGAEAVE